MYLEDIDKFIRESQERLYRYDLFNGIFDLLWSIGFKMDGNYPIIKFSQAPTESYAIFSVEKLTLQFPIYHMKSEQVTVSSLEELLLVLSKSPMYSGDIKSNIEKSLIDLKLTNLLE